MAGSDPRFYFYPMIDGSLSVVDLGEQLAALDEMPTAQRADAYAGGVNYSSFLQEQFRVRIVLQLVSQTATAGAATERRLQTLVNHLLRGGYVGFSRDHSKSWCAAQSAVVWDRGASSIGCGGSGFTAWSAFASLVSGDEVVVETASVGPYREYHTTSGIVATAATSVGLAETLEYAYPFDLAGTLGLVRYRYFWPLLWLPEDQISRPILTSSRGITWTLDVTLAYSMVAAAALFGTIGSGVATGVIPLRDATGVGSGHLKSTLDWLAKRGVSAATGPNLPGSPTMSMADRFDPRVRG